MDISTIKVYSLAILSTTLFLTSINALFQFFVLLVTFLYTIYKLINERNTYLDNKKQKKENECN